MRNNIIYIIYFLICSCNTPKFYGEINSMQNEIKKEIELKNNQTKNNKIKGYDFNKLVLSKLRNELKNTNHIIYYNYSDNDSFSFKSKKKWFIIYDLLCGLDMEIFLPCFFFARTFHSHCTPRHTHTTHHRCCLPPRRTTRATSSRAPPRARW